MKVTDVNANVINRDDCLTFTNLMIKLKNYCPKKSCSISASFNLDEIDKSYEKRICLRLILEVILGNMYVLMTITTVNACLGAIHASTKIIL